MLLLEFSAARLGRLPTLANRKERAAVHAGMNANSLHRVAPAGLGLAALTLLAGCAGSPAWGGFSKRPSNAEIATVIENNEPVEPPAQPAQLQAPRRPMKTEVTFGDDK